jgi:hypothetical protein
MEELKKDRDKLQCKMMDVIYEFEQKHGVLITELKGFRDKTFGGDGVYTIKVKVEI